MADYRTMGERLRALREEAGLSREQLRERAGERSGRKLPTGQTLYRYEKGEILAMDVGIAVAIAEAVDTDVRWIVDGDPTSADPVFERFEADVAPALRPPMTLAERGKLVWMRHHAPTPEKYLAALLREREGRTPELAKASDEATKEAQRKGDAWGVKPRKRS